MGMALTDALMAGYEAAASAAPAARDDAAPASDPPVEPVSDATRPGMPRPRSPDSPALTPRASLPGQPPPGHGLGQPLRRRSGGGLAYTSAVEHVVTIPAEPFSLDDSRVVVHQVPDARDNLVWILEDPHTSTAAAIDGPGADAAEAFASTRGLKITTIFNTHTHGDHVGINRAYARAGRLDEMEVIGAASRADDIPGLTRPVVEGDEVAFGDATLRVLETPGHIDGHVSFAASGAVFCGDTLFAGGCGYLFDGPPIAMFQSLHRLAALPERTRVCCAHEYTEDNPRFAWMVEAGNDALARRIQTVGRCEPKVPVRCRPPWPRSAPRTRSCARARRRCGPSFSAAPS